MKKVLVLGSTGSIGQYLVTHLADMGYSVTAVSPEDQVPYNNNVECIRGDAKNVVFLKELLAKGYDGVVDFMTYYKRDFHNYIRLFLERVKHYIFLSSCRVYANEEWPVRETSPRLLDSSKDKVLLESNDYSIYKAQQEDMLKNSGKSNWTAVRPSTTFSKMRYRLVTLEAADCVGRALRKKKVLLPVQAKNVQTTLSWAGDVSKMIARLLFNRAAMGEIYNVCSAEHRTWGEIAGYYNKIMGLQVIWVDKEDYLRIIDPAVPPSARWQLEHAGLFKRITDNTKVLKATGMKQADLMPMFDALKRMVEAIPEGYAFPETDIGRRMDEYILRK